jgi:hypothetical protein
MAWLSLVLRLCAPIFGIVGALHLSLGVGADVLLGAQLPDAALADPALDSQNRFYGVAFALYGLLLYRCALDLRAGAPILRIVIWTFFAAGLARIVSIATHGVPPRGRRSACACSAPRLACQPLATQDVQRLPGLAEKCRGRREPGDCIVSV